MACSQNTQLKNVSFQAKHLVGAEIQTRRPAAVATIGINTAAAQNARVINVTSDVAVDLDRGAMLTFLDSTASRRLAAFVTEDVSLAATTATDVKVAPLFDAIPATVGDALYYTGMRALLGMTTYDVQTSPQTVDVTSAEDGDGMSMDIVRSSREISCSIVAKANNAGYYDVIQPIAVSPGQLGCEIYCELVFPDGETYLGAAKITNFSQPGNPNEVKRASFTVSFQGDSFDHYPPYIFA